MRHRVAGRKLNRTSAHRMATLRNLAQSLFEHGQIRTTLPKAKELQPFAERLITIAKKAREGDLKARRRVVRILTDRAVIPADQQETYEGMSDAARDKVLRARTGRRHRTGEARPGTPFTAESIVRRLIEVVAADFVDRPGGYTRLIKLADTRIGDGSPLAVVQLVGQEEEPGSVRSPEPTARRRRSEARHEMLDKGLSPRQRRAETSAKAEKRAKARGTKPKPPAKEEEPEASVAPAQAEEADTRKQDDSEEKSEG
ncbi:MAG: 50S ribosomal protein L17 [Phycisphaerae bacterium]|nr:50S ribosomal protein L17 [Phycisphaerae bacterium]